MAREIIGADNFIEVFVNAPLQVCEQRDVKGLYKKARSGEIKNFTGIDSPFEEPQSYDIEIRTDILDVDNASQKLYKFVLPKIKYDGEKI